MAYKKNQMIISIKGINKCSGAADGHKSPTASSIQYGE